MPHFFQNLILRNGVKVCVLVPRQKDLCVWNGTFERVPLLHREDLSVRKGIRIRSFPQEPSQQASESPCVRQSLNGTWVKQIPNAFLRAMLGSHSILPFESSLRSQSAAAKLVRCGFGMRSGNVAEVLRTIEQRHHLVQMQSDSAYARCFEKRIGNYQ